MKLSFSIFVALCINKGFAHSTNDGISANFLHEERELSSCQYKANAGNSCAGTENLNQNECLEVLDTQKCTNGLGTTLANQGGLASDADIGNNVLIEIASYEPGCYAIKTGLGNAPTFLYYKTTPSSTGQPNIKQGDKAICLNGGFDPCATNQCLHGGTCNNDRGNAICTCTGVYTGDFCQDNPCDQINCDNGGTCDTGTGTCFCSGAYFGTLCEENPCDQINCDNGGICDTGTGTCSCSGAYFGTLCEENPCDQINCDNGGTCDTGTGTCSCSGAYFGTLCKENPCDPNPCLHGGTCDTGTGTCNCDGTGYFGTLCEIDDPCDPNPCLHSGTCNSADGSCTCIQGFTGDTCDECQNGPNFDPDQYCTGCVTPFSGANCDEVVAPPADPCSGIDCGSNGTCNNGICICADGFTGTSCEVPPSPPAAFTAPDSCESLKCNKNQCKIDGNGEAYCKCENTFQYDANNKSCECPEGTTLNQNSNRCVGPPTSAPTKSPTVSPTASPTKSPSPLPVASPIDVGAITEDDCNDLPNFTFKLEIGNEVACDWLSKNKQKAADRKARYCGETHIYSACQKSCDTCNVKDSENKFKLDNVDNEVECDWLTKNKDAVEARRNRYCFHPTNCEAASEDVGALCPVSCGFTKGEHVGRECPEGEVGAILVETSSNPDPPSPSVTGSVPATPPSSKGSSKGNSKGSSKGSTGRKLRYRNIRK